MILKALRTAAAVSLVATAASAQAQELPKIPAELESVRQGLSKYTDYNQSDREFYAAIGCVWYGDIDGGTPDKFVGGGGEMTEVSYPKLNDGKIDPMAPEGLIYEQGEGGAFRLAAAVYMMPATPTTPRPTLFGQPFQGPIHADKATPLQHVNMTVYELHVWFWKENPDGLFKRSNPKLPCLFDSYEIHAAPAAFPAPELK